MEKNYYEILEVDKNASPEIIKKAYSTLAKKYHPDLQPKEKKYEYEEKFKLINQAYDTLSNNKLRKQYNENLSTCFVPKDLYDKIYTENQQLKQIINNTKNSSIQQEQNNNSYINKTPNYQSTNDQQTYSFKNSYSNFQSNTNYNDDYYYNKKNIKDFFKRIFSISIAILFFLILWKTTILQNIISFIFNIF